MTDDTLDGILDCCVRHRWSSDDELVRYLPPSWRAYVGESNARHGGHSLPLVPTQPFVHPLGARVANLPTPPDDDAGSRHTVDRALLVADDGMFTPALPNHYLAREVVRAINDWTIDRWLSSSGPYYGTIIVPTQVPRDAVAEIERVGDHPRMIGVLLATSGNARPFGHPHYHDVYEAAAERDLTIVIHTGGDAVPDALTHPAAVGPPVLYSEMRALASQPLASHFISLVSEGVLDRFPDLRVLFLGAGATWLAPLLWRSDQVFYALRATMPWMKRAPSDYLHSQVRIGTYPSHIGGSVGQQVVALLKTYPGMEHVLCYASGYPNREYDAADAVADSLPAAWRDNVLRDNARTFLFGETGVREAAPALSVS